MTRTPTATPTRAAFACVGDCDGGGSVSAFELFDMTFRSVLCDGDPAAACGELAACVAGDANGDGEISALEIFQATQNNVFDCPAT